MKHLAFITAVAGLGMSVQANVISFAIVASLDTTAMSDVIPKRKIYVLNAQ